MHACYCEPTTESICLHPSPVISGRRTGGGGQPERPRSDLLDRCRHSRSCMRAARARAPRCIGTHRSNGEKPRREALRPHGPCSILLVATPLFSHGTLFQSWRLTHRSRGGVRARGATTSGATSTTTFTHLALEATTREMHACMHAIAMARWPTGRDDTLWIVALLGEMAS